MSVMAARLKPCGPVVDAKAAERAREIVAETVWTPELEAAWPALAPIFGALRPSSASATLPRASCPRASAMRNGTGLTPGAKGVGIDRTRRSP